MTLEDILLSGADELGITLPDGAAGRYRTYFSLLEEKNKVMNLTAVSGEEDAARLHFLDSLALLTVCPFRDLRVIDVGAGAGFPGLPLLFAEPSVKLTLLDSLGKRVDFLRGAAEALGVTAECVNARAEEASLKPDMRDIFDIAVSRAVARLDMLCELCLPFVKPGGVFLAMKGADSDAEIGEAEHAAFILGGGKPQIRSYRIPGTDVTHRVVMIPKLKGTPDGYPRRFAKIKKSPL